MALPVSKIGFFDFMALYGQLEPPARQVEVDQRPGVDGSEILDTGKRGVPFTLISRRDCASYDEGQDFFNQYKTSIGSPVGALAIKQSDYDTQTHGYVCKVLAVRLLSCRRSPVIVGGLNYTSGAILECEWTLLGISQ